MPQTLNEKVDIIRENLLAGPPDLMDVGGSFRVNFESGQSVYIYVETYDNAIIARFDTRETDPVKRYQEMEALRRLLAREISFASINEFDEIPSGKDRFAYTAEIVVDESVVFHETITYDAGPALDDEYRETADARPAGASSSSLDSASPSVSGMSLAEKAIEELETIDGKMLRQSLDMMNLRRSSGVRMALTRIFRNAVDAEELMAATMDEAEKLTSGADREDLSIIKAINTEGFLTPVIDLLYDAVMDGDAD